MEIVDIKENRIYLEEYIRLCSLEWGSLKSNENPKDNINKKVEAILKKEKKNLISVLGLIDNNKLLGFISIFESDEKRRLDLTPWYATMYVKEEYRKKGYSKILNDSILKEAKQLGYSKIYLKTDLINYYEKFGAKYLEKLNEKENLYYIKL